MTKRTKQIPPFRLDMDPDEFLARAIRTKPGEVEASIKRSKQKKPPGGKKKRKPPGDPQSNVVSLRRRMMRKRNTGR
jgi:hypothetical protein